MIIDRLENAARYYAIHPGFEAALRTLSEADFDALEPGAHEIDGTRLSMNVIAGEGHPEAEMKLEAHRQYIDIQYCVSGDESFGWKPTSDCVEPEAEFDEEKDFVLFTDKADGLFPLPEGCFVVFFPEDAHGPMVGEGAIRKAVAKVAVDW